MKIRIPPKKTSTKFINFIDDAGHNGHAAATLRPTASALPATSTLQPCGVWTADGGCGAYARYQTGAGNHRALVQKPVTR